MKFHVMAAAVVLFLGSAAAFAPRHGCRVIGQFLTHPVKQSNI